MTGWFSAWWQRAAAQAWAFDRPVAAVLILAALVVSWPGWACAAWLRGAVTPMALPDLALVASLLALASLLITARPWLTLLLLLPLYLLQPAEWFVVLAYHTLVTPEMLAALRCTNPGEAGEFMGTHLGALVVVHLAAVGLFAVGWAVCWRRRMRCRLPGTLRLSAAILLLAAAGAVHAARGAVHGGGLRRLAHTAWLGGPLRAAITVAQDRQVAALAADRRAWRHDAVVTDPGPALQVLLIGESCRAGHWQLTGYPRETNPRLVRRRGELAVFTDVAACGNLTTFAVPPMLTGLAPGDHDRMRRVSSLVAAAREAGYRTVWYSNQSPSGDYDTLVAAYAAEADTTRWFNASPVASEWGAIDSADGRLVDALAVLLADPPPRLLVVLHLQGNHLRYECRYGPEHERFRPAPPPGTRPDYAGRPTECWNAYDNSILLQDELIDRCIALHAATGRPGTVVFLGDHGESLGEDGRFGHGTCPPPVHELRVPWLVWAAPAWRAARPAAWDTLLAHRDRPISTRDLRDTLLDLAGIRVRDRDPTRSLADPAYADHPREVVTVDGTVIDFDLAVPAAATGRVAVPPP
jgi:glucan phosphoethanolaminetransferase (alkaline phosphatase superfamily)